MPDISKSDVRWTDGTFDFSYGVDSDRSPTVLSETNPNGLPRNALAWLRNGSVRSGSVSPRAGWLKRVDMLATALFQGAYVYQPIDGTQPYIIASVAGNIYQMQTVAPYAVTNLSVKFGLFNPASPPQVWMEQGEQFLVIQAGDYATTGTLPLFWDGATLRRSNGLNVAQPGQVSYSLTVTQSWVVPAVGSTVTVNLAVAYPGKVTDIINWPGVGQFQVTAVATTTVTLLTLQSALVGLTVVNGTYPVTVTPGNSSAVYNLTTTNSPTAFSETPGSVIQINLSSQYPGNLGDSIFWIGIGQFNVVGLSANKQTVILQWVANLSVGIPAAGAVVWAATSATNQLTTTLTPVTTTNSPAFAGVGVTYAVTLSAPYAGPGNVGDTIFWTGPTGLGGQMNLVGISANKQTLYVQEEAWYQGSASAPAPGNYNFLEVAGTLAQNGSILLTATPTTIPVGAEPELPAAGPMSYYQGRMWYAVGTIFTAGDIVRGPSGTTAYAFRDSILKVTENPLAIGGDGFAVPANAGTITALKYAANLNVQLGQGPLYIFTATGIFSLVVPVTRADWIAASGANAPLVTVAQLNFGTPSDRCVVPVNGDLFYSTMEPDIRTLIVAQRFFKQWANVGIAANESRIWRFQNTSLMATSSGVLFNNRLLEAVLPVTTPCGVGFQGMAVLDFNLISTLQQQLPPAWEGVLEGLDVLQLLSFTYNNTQSAFAIVHSKDDGSIDLWELTATGKTDNADSRIQWGFETPAFTFFKEYDMKELDGAEMWIDRVLGTVDVTLEYREDANACWHPWLTTQFCSAQNTCESLVDPVCYPVGQQCAGYKFPLVFNKPKADGCAVMMNRPTNRGYQFQVRVTVKGHCRVRGLLLFALPIARKPYDGLVCGT